MQKPIKTDYRDLFSFEICYPIIITKEVQIGKMVLDFIEEGFVPTAILKDKEGPEFQRLKKERGTKAYRETVAIVHIVQLTKEYLA